MQHLNSWYLSNASHTDIGCLKQSIHRAKTEEEEERKKKCMNKLYFMRVVENSFYIQPRSKKKKKKRERERERTRKLYFTRTL